LYSLIVSAVIARIISSMGCTLFVFSFFMVLCGVVLAGRVVIGFSVVGCAGLPERVFFVALVWFLCLGMPRTQSIVQFSSKL
jgi:hypothetical protein